MAFIKNIKLNNGIEVQNAYGKVTSVNGGKSGAVIEFNFYLNEESSNNGVEPLIQSYFIFEPDCTDTGGNFIKQGYEYLKTLDEYKDAVDC